MVVLSRGGGGRILFFLKIDENQENQIAVSNVFLNTKTTPGKTSADGRFKSTDWRPRAGTKNFRDEVTRREKRGGQVFKGSFFAGMIFQNLGYF